MTFFGNDRRSASARMKAIDRPFTKVINGTTQFVIPVFQRDWFGALLTQLT
jgi:hypothetical protein